MPILINNFPGSYRTARFQIDSVPQTHYPPAIADSGQAMYLAEGSAPLLNYPPIGFNNFPGSNRTGGFRLARSSKSLLTSHRGRISPSAREWSIRNIRL